MFDFTFLSQGLAQIKSFGLFSLFLGYGALAPLFLRLALGGYLLSVSIHKWKSGHFFGKTVYRKILSLLYVLTGLLLVLGILVQPAALLATLLAFSGLVRKEHRKENWLALGIAISLLVLGAGSWVINLPF
jgi:hypothetical protein